MTQSPPPVADPDVPPREYDAPVSPALLFLRRYRVAISLLLVPVVFLLIGLALYHLTREVRYDEVRAAIAATPATQLGLAVLFTAISFFALTFYDYAALDYIGHPLPYPQSALTAFSAYAVGNIAGFGPLSGGAIRYRAYSRLGLEPEEIARVIAFVTLAFGLGIAAIGALALLPIAPMAAHVTGLAPVTLRLGALALLLALLALFFAGGGGRALRIAGLDLRLPDSLTASRQFLVTCVDVAAAASVLYVLLPHGVIGWPALLCVYAVALTLGVLSHVPGGLGVFETVIIAGLGPAANLDQVLSALILYRAIYFVLPLMAAILLVGAAELRQSSENPAVVALRRVGARLAPALLATLTLVTGSLLVFASVAPLPAERADAFAAFLPLFLVEGAHFLSSLLGLVLIVSARGLAHRLDGALWLSLICAALALVLTPLRAGHFAQPALLAFLIAALFVSRGVFDRRASLLAEALTPVWLAAMALVVIAAGFILFFVYRDVQYSHDLWWQFEFAADAPRGLRALLGLALLTTTLAIASLLRPVTVQTPLPGEAEIARATAIVAAQDAAGANLVRMGDKRLLFSEDGRAFLMYGRQGRSWIALFDPVGPRELWPELIWRFIETARAAGARAVFYQVSTDLLPICADAGLRAVKLGEMAVVDLTRFDLKGGSWSAMRNALSRGERDGLVFEILPPEALPPLYEELRAISDAWLRHHDAREKRFSLGAFERDYVLSQPMALLRFQGRIVAFANLMRTDGGAQCSIDLMRFAPDAPSGAMVFLFAKTMLAMRDAGVRSFLLGMAPLAGMSGRESAPVWDMIGGTVYEHGERFYNFKGLRAFKEKFRPDWEPRYLAIAGGATPMMALMDATLLIGGGFKGVIGK
ncbi:MAG: bifunctional lysylphosphatidylglycerol flippase/synthetase MprF [Rhodovulum sulfidophilum]|uniref:Phosphatidylglycerol lysyltransferase n=1 Tax=Rhodovulum sulfidophilum TaxID=35806 RepID=A0A2W5NFI4_RHOSU|nr:MAG: bifunctional lysylphosphatidylglycerol flippase/synthetase MprF [Rhodovulum sulfidophilum]